MSPIDDLSDSDADTVALVIRSTAGTLGPFGGVIGEVCTSLIPNQRHERIVRYVRAFARELEEHAERLELIEQRLLTDEGSDLLAEGVVQAARAVSKERLSRLARVVARGLTDDEFEYDRAFKTAFEQTLLTEGVLDATAKPKRLTLRSCAATCRADRAVASSNATKT